MTVTSDRLTGAGPRLLLTVPEAAVKAKRSVITCLLSRAQNAAQL